MLSVAGFTSDEIGAMLGLSYTRVNALATEANKPLRTERPVEPPRSLAPRALPSSRRSLPSGSGARSVAQARG